MKSEQQRLDAPRLVCFHPALAAPYGKNEVKAWRCTLIETLKAQGFHICGKVCARRHRRRGRYVIPLGNGRFAWKGRSWSINTWLVADPRVRIVEKRDCSGATYTSTARFTRTIREMKDGEVP